MSMCRVISCVVGRECLLRTNLWDTTEAILRGNCIAGQSYLRKQEKISNRQASLTPKATREMRTNKTQS